MAELFSNWFVLSIISVLSLSLFYLLTKKILNGNDSDPRIFGGVMQLTVGLLALPIALVSGFKFDLSLDTILLLLLVGSVYALAASFYYTGLKKVDVSKSVIFESSGVFWSLLLGTIFLSENLNPNKIFASILIFISILIISKKQRLGLGKSELFILLASVFYAIGAVLDNYTIGFSNSSTYLSLSFLFAGAITLLTNVHRLKKHGAKMLGDSGFWKLLITNSAFIVISYWALFRAYELGGEVSILYPITHTQTVLVPIMGMVFLKEIKDLKQKFVALIVTIIALFIIRPM